MTWTSFDDMCSGGYLKTEYMNIFIEDEKSKAVKIFEDKFDFSPYGETCECCGSDYWIEECGPTDEDKNDENILIITAEEISHMKI